MPRTADWYFDYLSPYAYLQFESFARLPDDLEVTLKPVLFAGLLGYWDNLGPAEIPAKRRQTYRYCHWLAGKRGVPFKAPPRHPFNIPGAGQVDKGYERRFFVGEHCFGRRDNFGVASGACWHECGEELFDQDTAHGRGDIAARNLSAVAADR